MATLFVRPWACARQSADQGALQDVLARVSVERGHFRDITEAGLLEEIASANTLAASDSDGDGEDSGGDENYDQTKETEMENEDRRRNKPWTREELFRARFDMLQHVQTANNDAMIVLDYLSLLQSKEAPTQAANTISPNLKSNVPLGSLGMDIWQRMQFDKARDAQDEVLAHNVRSKALQQSADDLLMAANRLHDAVEKETKYWDRILSITSKNWNVCRLPGPQHRLGVTYGFSESSPEFVRRGIVALATNSTGDMIIEHGNGSKRQILHVNIKRRGQILGSSQIHRLHGEHDMRGLEHQIRDARDSLFDAEIYREMIRESRSMASRGVRLNRGEIQLQAGDTETDSVEVVFELRTLDDMQAAEPVRSDDLMATAVAITARLLLSRAHRDRLIRRSEPPPPLSTDKEEDRPLVPILRPILSFLMQQNAIECSNRYLDNLCSLLSVAGIQSSVDHAHFNAAETGAATDAESLVAMLLQAWTSTARLKIHDNVIKPFTLALEISTTLASGLGPSYVLQTSNERRARYTDIEHLQAAADQVIAASLIGALADVAEGEWKYQEREATITKLSPDEGVRSSISIAVNHRSSTLVLHGKKRTLVWAVGQIAPEHAFCSAWKDLA